MFGQEGQTKQDRRSKSARHTSGGRGGDGHAIVVGREKHNAFVSYRGRVTRVAPECVRKASVAEQTSWETTTQEKTLCENALDGEDVSWEESVPDESHEFLDTEPPDIVKEPTSIEEEVNSQMKDDDDRHILEPSVAENEDSDEDEQPTEAPSEEIPAERSEVVGHDQLRQSLKQSRRMERLPELSREKKR